MASRKRGKKTTKEKLDEAVQHCEQLFEKPKKPKKSVTYELFRDPDTGCRETRYPYNPSPRTKKQPSKGRNENLPSFSQDSVDSASDADTEDLLPTEDPSSNIEGDCLTNALKECHSILESYGDPIKPNWEDRMAALTQNWENCRDGLLKSKLTSEGKCTDSCHCVSCGITPSIIRCADCGGKKLCASCGVAIHKDKPFHERDAYLDGFYQPIAPTTAVDDSGSLIQIETPVRIKRHVVESAETLSRWKEEVPLVKKEMTNFIRFYLDSIAVICCAIKALEEQLEAISSVANCPDGDESSTVLFKVIRYETTSTDEPVLQGKLSCLKKGLFFCKTQIHNAVTKFEKTTKCITWSDSLEDLVDVNDNDSDESRASDSDEDDEDDELVTGNDGNLATSVTTTVLVSYSNSLMVL